MSDYKATIQTFMGHSAQQYKDFNLSNKIAILIKSHVIASSILKPSMMKKKQNEGSEYQRGNNYLGEKNIFGFR